MVMRRCDLGHSKPVRGGFVCGRRMPQLPRRGCPAIDAALALFLLSLENGFRVRLGCAEPCRHTTVQDLHSAGRPQGVDSPLPRKMRWQVLFVAMISSVPSSALFLIYPLAERGTKHSAAVVNSPQPLSCHATHIGGGKKSTRCVREPERQEALRESLCEAPNHSASSRLHDTAGTRSF